ncbi:DUF2220 domain-containing protein [Clostridium sp. CS001]|uniref:Wadjet anti-phage system protein JetD domain-containing protein n=1 Tax=Clostridium sp. CS001 TaxID=2880648 RepID=UPI001CF3398C|nr:Wadjet anti-phage system protein JetD domain-containing protein [Clostridium sp. CS001]MCB2290817.1 DUF2220 domain-containing protein [Clostridium sp. CS001]
MRNLNELNKTRLDLTDIEKFYNISEYRELVPLINELIEKGVIIPTKKSKTNGKDPWLFTRYTLVKVEENNTDHINEIKNELFIGLNTSYYLSHIDLYKADREYVIELSNYLRNNRQSLSVPVSINERSFEIWGKEKFLKDSRGQTIIKNVGLNIEDFNFYYTPEPFVFFSFTKCENQRVLIIENKDTWYSIRKLMLEGDNNILGTYIDTIIYASGKGRFKGLLEYDLMVEKYLRNPKEVLYWGDIDYEGIVIYEGLKTKFKDMFNLHIFNGAYKKMIFKSLDKKLPSFSEGQNKNITDLFLSELDMEDKNEVIKIFANGLYIPQEIITYKDLKYRGD